MDTGFVQGSSDNLPLVDMFMIVQLMKNDDRFNTSEIRGSKALHSSRENYGDKAVGYVQLKRDGPVCTVKARICPEHRVRNKPYSVTLVVDEQEEKIISVDCHDCPASLGGCKHALATLMWVHRRNEEPSPTEIACYWKKPIMANVGTSMKAVTLNQLVKPNRPQCIKLPNNDNVLKELVTIAQTNNIDCQLSRHNLNLPLCEKFNTVTIYRSLIAFHERGGTYSKVFVHYLRYHMRQKIGEKICEEVEIATRNQSKSPLWHELRYGRITASKLYEAARCKTADGVLVESIIGASKLKDTSAMKRGRFLEKQVLQVVEQKLHVDLKDCGIILLPQYPILGASPDAISNEFVVEIKCPTSEKATDRYIHDGKINNKYKAQIHLQMFAAKKTKGVFCVAKPDFEESKNVTLMWVDYDKEFLDQLIVDAMQFWHDNIFDKLFKCVSD